MKRSHRPRPLSVLALLAGVTIAVLALAGGTDGGGVAAGKERIREK